MSDRTPATEKGTADRVEADDGGYWVRLVTKQALRREGECMQNCLARGHYADTAGEEDLVSTGVWSLRKAGGLSYMDVSVVRCDVMFAHNAEGPKGSQPSGWSCRQLRHLVAAFRDAGATMRVLESIAPTGEDGRTWRPDKAPQEVRDAIEARKKAEVEARRKERADNPSPRYDIPYGQVMIRPAGSSEPYVLAGDIGPLSFGLDTQALRQGEVAVQQVRIDTTERPDVPIIRSGIEIDDGPPPAATRVQRFYTRVRPPRTRDDVMRDIAHAEDILTSGTNPGYRRNAHRALRAFYEELATFDEMPPPTPVRMTPVRIGSAGGQSSWTPRPVIEGADNPAAGSPPRAGLKRVRPPESRPGGKSAQVRRSG